jgi:hypothetical protein
MNKKGAPTAMKKNQKAKLPSRHRPVLRFSPTAWAKLLFLRDAGDTEIGALGIAANDDLLFVEDVQLVAQTCTSVSVKFDDGAVATFFDEQVDRGRRPESFARLWLHTHPADSAEPSGTDEATFARVFGRSDWAVMFILAAGGQTSARLRLNVGPGADVQLPVEVEFSRPFAGTDFAAWREEYERCIRVPMAAVRPTAGEEVGSAAAADLLLEDWHRAAWSDYLEHERYLRETEYGVNHFD